MAKVMYQFIYDKVPFKFNDYFKYSSEVSTNISRNVFKNSLFFPPFKLSKTQRFIKFVSVKVWNNIQNSIKKLLFTKFKESYKKFLSAKFRNSPLTIK